MTNANDTTDKHYSGIVQYFNSGRKTFRLEITTDEQAGDSQYNQVAFGETNKRGGNDGRAETKRNQD